MKKLSQIFLIIVLSLLLNAFALVPAEEAKTESSLMGRVKVLGREPFTEIVIETPEGESYQILNGSFKGLKEQEGALVILQGEVQSHVSLYCDKAIYVKEFSQLEHGALPED